MRSFGSPDDESIIVGTATMDSTRTETGNKRWTNREAVTRPS